MGKGKRLKKLRRTSEASFSDKFQETFTRNFQKELKNSELWDEIVAQHGEKCALELVRECKAEVKTDMEIE
ncbi:hypothetical protein DSCO28_35480 [Desulfosarcina ovata subsp. sediminis]|uniref:Uncharacterized protein n=1 Tax=Desulfosarcina ovata subsp. sediminis TaxID=885957 RepID=A0A5K7ZS00_9BACT|nr:hypothetical protein [Desulfosarcina ovata]BBO82982.1 hypothetical protein DSCO28_35480 [Desulfosarcina ovata subsp. sediminis]